MVDFFFSMVSSSSWSSSGVRDATDESNEVFEKSNVSRFKKPNIPADLNFLHYISNYIYFRENTEVYFRNKPFLTARFPPLPPPPLKVPFRVAIARAQKTIPAVHGHVKTKDVTVFVKRLIQYLVI